MAKPGRKPIPKMQRVVGTTVYLTPADTRRIKKHFKTITAAVLQIVLPECERKENQLNH